MQLDIILSHKTKKIHSFHHIAKCVLFSPETISFFSHSAGRDSHHSGQKCCSCVQSHQLALVEVEPAMVKHCEVMVRGRDSWCLPCNELRWLGWGHSPVLRVFSVIGVSIIVFLPSPKLSNALATRLASGMAPLSSPCQRPHCSCSPLAR